MPTPNFPPRWNGDDPMGNSNGSILVQFRAGRCKVEGTTVTPDTRKGVFRIIQDEQHLKHVQWIDRSNGLIEEDYFTFSDVDLERISQSSGRVFLLRWRDRSNKLFFWMQETNAERDEDHFLLIRQALNGPEAGQTEAPGPEDPSAAVSTPTATPAVDESNSEQQTAPSQLTTEQLQYILESMNPQMSGLDIPSVAELLSPEVVLPILRDPAIEQSLQSLVEHLPEDDSSPEAVAELLSSPQFRQQVAALSQALQAGQAGELLRSFGIDAQSNESGMVALLQGLLRYHAQARNMDPSEDNPMDET
eukprot:CAMPEP_0184746802 /NCGR_PEP_ID=MMETSP0315-20130426/9325_1 /TAXON_ID=101924 /ORGANISM="Rhodosorus marinus, Strain UTEX LB 2760" /LENGTH=304 /DNA_ID=CAMNT_0027219539 /DNA_START=347 /DNA_END=1261 /DNA_ORIENTATION=-